MPILRERRVSTSPPAHEPPWGYPSIRQLRRLKVKGRCPLSENERSHPPLLSTIRTRNATFRRGVRPRRPEVGWSDAVPRSTPRARSAVRPTISRDTYPALYRAPPARESPD